MVEIVNIKSQRKFSREAVQYGQLVEGDLDVKLICFESGQRASEQSFERDGVYQPLEGEMLLRSGGSSLRVGEGRLVKVPAGTSHSLENAGGGLLVVLAFWP